MSEPVSYVGLRLQHPDLTGVTLVTVAQFPPGEEPGTVLMRREDGLPFTWRGQTSTSALLDVRAIGGEWQVIVEAARGT